MKDSSEKEYTASIFCSLEHLKMIPAGKSNGEKSRVTPCCLGASPSDVISQTGR